MTDKDVMQLWRSAYRAGMERAVEVCEETVQAVNYSSAVDPAIPENIKWAGRQCAAAIRKEIEK